MSLRELAAELSVEHSHLSRALRGSAGKTLTSDLVVRIRTALSLPAGYFPEEREATVIQRVREDAALRDWLYARISRKAARSPDASEKSEPKRP